MKRNLAAGFVRSDEEIITYKIDLALNPNAVKINRNRQKSMQSNQP